MNGIAPFVLLHQPRIVAAPPGLSWWVACRNVSWEDLPLLHPIQTVEVGRETLAEIHPDGQFQTEIPLIAAIREVVQAYRRDRFTLQLSSGEFSLGPAPLLVGVLNVTPDSFYDGGGSPQPAQAIEKGERLAAAGADWIDVGGESTRPGAEPVAAQAELDRALPVIEALSKRISAPISIDTMKAEVAAAAVRAGASVVNDVSGLRADPEMAKTVASLGVPAIVNHMRGTPATMQDGPRYADPLAEILEELRESVDRGLRAGISAHKIIADPGFGFGKRPEDNLAVLRRFHELRSLGLPLMAGVSRKSFLGKVLDGRPPENRLFGTAAAVALAVVGGARLLRVHDPAEMRDVARVAAAVVAGIA